MVMEKSYKSKYHREEPIRNIDVNQKLYDAVFNTNKDNMDSVYSSFFGYQKTFNDLKRESDILAIYLHQIGVKDEEKVGLLMLTVPEVSSCMLAINKIGANAYFMDASLKANDLIHYLNDNDVKVLCISEPLYPLINEIKKYTKLESCVVIPIDYKINKYDDIFINYIDILKYTKLYDISYPKYDKEKPSLTVQSSGSTGASKSIVHTDYNFNSEILKMAYTDLPFYKGKKALVCAPPWVIYGICNSIYSGLLFGAETVYTLEPNEPMIYNNIGKFDYVYGVPVYYRYLYNKILELEKSEDPNDIERLKFVKNELYKTSAFIAGGDKISEKETILWGQKFMTPIINGYGNNESTGAAIVSPYYANKPGSIGVPMYGNLTKVYDEKSDKMLGTGKLGELCISSDSLFKYYINNESATNEIKREHDGKLWVHTGDLARIDEDGFVYIEGRIKRLILDKLGYKISPESLENIISKLEYVNECCVVGALLSEHNMVPMAFIELKEKYKNNIDIVKQIEDYCYLNMKEYERPKIFKEIENIPHKENGGKVDFLKLEKLAKEYVEKGKEKILVK